MLQAGHDDVELQFTHRGQHRFATYMVRRVENLHDPFFFQLLESLWNCLCLEMSCSQEAETFRRKVRNGIEGHRWIGGQCIADGEQAGINQTHHIAGTLHRSFFRSRRRAGGDARHPDLAEQSGVVHHHTFSNRREQMRRNAIRSRCCGSMFADLEHEAGERIVGRLNLSLGRGAARGGASVVKASRNGPTPKFVNALPKNIGVSPGEKPVSIKRGACACQ